MNYYLRNSFYLSLILLASCSSDKEIKLEQYQIAGEKLYLQHCANCHGKDGEGLRNLYPPIKGSDFLKNRNKVICIIKNGGKGSVTVNGKVYDELMPKNKELYDLDIAQIVTYIYSKYDNLDRIIETDEVKYAKCEQ